MYVPVPSNWSADSAMVLFIRTLRFLLREPVRRTSCANLWENYRLIIRPAIRLTVSFERLHRSVVLFRLQVSANWSSIILF
jgi:hypothetical protein